MTALITGLGLGFSAGISPGPLLTLVITRSLTRGFWAGLRVALAPLVTDALIITTTLLLFNSLPPLLEVLLTVGGGLFLIYLGVDAMRSAAHARLDTQAAAGPASADLWRGALVNLFSPHPWLFWISVGSPTLTRIWRADGPAYAVLFLLGFYALLIGGKIGVALAVAGGRRYLTERWYAWLLRLSGAVLCLFGLLLIAGYVRQYAPTLVP